MSRVQSLEEELEQMKETYQEKEKGLYDQIESLQQQLKHKVCTGGAAKVIKMFKIVFFSFSRSLTEAKHEKDLFVLIDVNFTPLQGSILQQSPGRHQRQADAAFGVRIERLNQELTAKTRTVQELSRTVARLQKERTGAPSVPNPRPETRSAETKRQPCPAKTCGGEETFPAAQYEKTYQPTVFTGGDVLHST